jgi:hypothetical protein
MSWNEAISLGMQGQELEARFGRTGKVVGTSKTS